MNPFLALVLCSRELAGSLVRTESDPFFPVHRGGSGKCERRDNVNY